MTRKRKSSKKNKTDKGRKKSMQPTPTCITAESLEKRLMCSDSRKRWLNALLHKAHPDSWPKAVDPSEFYSVLHGFIQSPNGRDRFNAAAAKVEKKNRPIRFHEAMHKHLVVTYGPSEELDEIYRNLQKSNGEGCTSLFRWVVKNCSAEEATQVVWATVPHKADKIQAVIDEVEELKDLLGPFQEYLADYEASLKARPTEPSGVIESSTSCSSQSDLKEDSVVTALSKLQVAITDLTAHSIDANQIESISRLVRDLSTAHDDKIAREAIDTSIKNVIEDALCALDAAGHQMARDKLDISRLAEGFSDDDVVSVSILTDSLITKNEQITELQKQLQENVLAEHLASMTEAVQLRDQYCQELEEVLSSSPNAGEPATISKDSGKQAPVVELDPLQSGDDGEAGAIKKEIDGLVSSEASVPGHLAEEASKPGKTETVPDKALGPAAKEEESRPPVKPVVLTNQESETELPCASIECRLESYAIAGEVSKCYWLTWASAALGDAGEISPIALQCVAAAGELAPVRRRA